MLKKLSKTIAVLSGCSSLMFGAGEAIAEGFIDDVSKAISSGKASGTFTVRYEENSLEGDVPEGDALNIRSRLGYTTGDYKGFTATLEFEDSRFIAGVDDNTGILEQEYTEVEQAFLQYKADGFTGKLGRQVIALDGQRHIGHVGWRLDRQTFDAARVTYSPIKDLTIDYSYVYKVNRINSPAFADVDVDNNLLNISYKTSYGKVAVYSYQLSADAPYDETDTLGFSFGGGTKVSDGVKVLYNVEFAQQDNETNDLDTDYTWFEIGAAASGFTYKLGIETLGSDEGNGSFETPLATVHKFAGWADVFAGQSLFGAAFGGVGLEDTYFSVATKQFGAKFVAAYHMYDPDEDAAFDSFGDEINLLALKPITKKFVLGAKYASFSGESDAPTTDKDVFWLWGQLKI